MNQTFQDNSFFHNPELTDLVYQVMEDPKSQIVVKKGLLQGRNITLYPACCLVKLIEAISIFFEKFWHNVCLFFSLEYREKFETATRLITEADQTLNKFHYQQGRLRLNGITASDVENFVECFLHPYLAGEISHEQSLNRQGLVPLLRNRINALKLEGVINWEAILATALDAYLTKAVDILYVHRNGFSDNIDETEITKSSPEFDALIHALKESLPIDFPHPDFEWTHEKILHLSESKLGYIKERNQAILTQEMLCVSDETSIDRRHFVVFLLDRMNSGISENQPQLLLNSKQVAFIDQLMRQFETSRPKRKIPSMDEREIQRWLKKNTGLIDAFIHQPVDGLKTPLLDTRLF